MQLIKSIAACGLILPITLSMGIHNLKKFGQTETALSNLFIEKLHLTI